MPVGSNTYAPKRSTVDPPGPWPWLHLLPTHQDLSSRPKVCPPDDERAASDEVLAGVRVQVVDPALRLRRRRAQLEAQLAVVQGGVHLRKPRLAHILQRVAQPLHEVRQVALEPAQGVRTGGAPTLSRPQRDGRVAAGGGVRGWEARAAYEPLSCTAPETPCATRTFDSVEK